VFPLNLLDPSEVALLQEKQKQQSFGRPIISTQTDDFRVVAVGGEQINTGSPIWREKRIPTGSARGTGRGLQNRLAPSLRER